MNNIEKLWDFFKFEKGETVIINGTKSTAIISDAIGSYYDDQNIRTDIPIKTGDKIGFQDKTWLVISEPDKNIKTYKAKIRQSNYAIKVYIGDVLYTFDAIIESESAAIQNGTVIDTAAGKIVVTIPSGEYADKIDIDTRFLKLGYAWKVSGVDRSRNGLNIIHADKDVFTSDDDKQNEIADRYKHEKVYAISVSNTQPVSVGAGATAQITFVVTCNGQQVTTLPEMICSSSNTAVASVDNTGLITGVSAGNANITCTVKDYPSATVTAAIQVSGVIAPSYTVSITYKGTAKIYSGGSAKTFTASVLNNGTAVTDKAVSWSVRNQDGSSTAIATITTFTDTTCALQAADNNSNVGKSVILTATLKDDSTVFYNLTVTIASLV